MIVTEEEAKTKRCQEGFGSPLTDGGYSYSAPYGGGSSMVVNTSPSHCIGSACMAWEWCLDLGSPTPDSQRRGYCGKARCP